jgi:ribosomal protein S20
LRQAAEALQAGDTQSAQSALAQVAEELTQTSSQQALNEAAEQLLTN